MILRQVLSRIAAFLIISSPSLRRRSGLSTAGSTLSYFSTLRRLTIEWTGPSWRALWRDLDSRLAGFMASQLYTGQPPAESSSAVGWGSDFIWRNQCVKAAHLHPTCSFAKAMTHYLWARTTGIREVRLPIKRILGS